MLFLGIDPGVRKLGFALIDQNLQIVDSGILLQHQKSPSREDQFQRILEIYDFFSDFLSQHEISAVGMEKLFFTSFNQNNAEFVFGVRGALAMLFLKNNMQFHEFSPIQVKKYITGNAKADKLFVQKAIMRLYRLQDLPKYNDAADALGLAYLTKLLTKSK